MAKSNARKRRRQRLAEWPDDESIMVHRWPDSWTVQNPWRWEDAEREGELVGHCLATPVYLDAEIGMARPFWILCSLRDPDGYPRVTFYLDLTDPANPEIIHAHSLGAGAGIAPQYQEKMAQVPALPLPTELREMELDRSGFEEREDAGPRIDVFLLAAQDFLQPETQ